MRKASFLLRLICLGLALLCSGCGDCDDSSEPQTTYRTVTVAAEYLATSSNHAPTPQWEWAGCIASVLNYYGLPVVVEDVFTRLYGRLTFTVLPAEPTEAVFARLDGWEVSKGGNRYRVTATGRTGSPETALLIGDIANRHPLIINYFDGSSGYPIIAYAVRYIDQPYGSSYDAPLVDSLHVIVPGERYPLNYNFGWLGFPSGSMAGSVSSYAIVRIEHLQ
jgi:hypothetical protein